jgi:hypothetical protein
MLEQAILKLADAIVYHADKTAGVIMQAEPFRPNPADEKKKSPAAERAKVIEQVDTPVAEAPVESVEMTKEEAAAFSKDVLQPAARAFTAKFPNMLKTLFPRFEHNGVVPVSVIKDPALHPSLYQAFADVLNKAIATGKLGD